MNLLGDLLPAMGFGGHPLVPTAPDAPPTPKSAPPSLHPLLRSFSAEATAVNPYDYAPRTPFMSAGPPGGSLSPFLSAIFHPTPGSLWERVSTPLLAMAGGMLPEEDAAAAVERILPHLEGATLDAKTLAPTARAGFAVADPAVTLTIPKDADVRKLLGEWYAQPAVQERLKVPSAHIGTWTDPKTGATEINVSHLMENEDQARMMGRLWKQKAIGHLGEGGQYLGDIPLEETRRIAGPALRIGNKVYSGVLGEHHTVPLLKAQEDFFARDRAAGVPERHVGDSYYEALKNAKPTDEGYVLEDGSYVDRDEAYRIAKANDQLIPDRFERLREGEELHSSDIAVPPPPKKSTALVGPARPQLPAPIRSLMDAEPFVPEHFALTRRALRAMPTGALPPFQPGDIKLPQGAPSVLGGAKDVATRMKQYGLPLEDVTPTAHSLAHYLADAPTKDAWIAAINKYEPGIAPLINRWPEVAARLYDAASEHAVVAKNLTPYHDLVPLAAKGSAIGPWYRNFISTLLGRGVAPREADMLNRFGAILSEQKSPQDEIRLAMTAWDRWLHGEPLTADAIGATEMRASKLRDQAYEMPRFEENADLPENASSTRAWGRGSALKTPDYYLLARGHEAESVALDRHVIRAYGLDPDKITEAQMNVLKARVLSDARRAGMSGGEWQARVWGGQTGYASGFGEAGATREDWVAHYLADHPRLMKRYPGLADLAEEGKYAREAAEAERAPAPKRESPPLIKYGASSVPRRGLLGGR